MTRVTKRTTLFAILAVMAAACSGEAAAGEEPTTMAPTTNTSTVATTTTVAPTTTSEHTDHSMGEEGEVDTEALAQANLAAAAFQDVAVAEAAGYASTIDALGCFESAEDGGMGLHYLNESLMDATVDPTQPEALVYELDADAEIVGLVAHEYIVPLEAWTEEEPPQLFGLDFHQHGVLPLWILHTWIWKDNPRGVFNDYNPRVRPCPDGVPIFGVDLP